MFITKNYRLFLILAQQNNTIAKYTQRPLPETPVDLPSMTESEPHRFPPSGSSDKIIGATPNDKTAFRPVPAPRKRGQGRKNIPIQEQQHSDLQAPCPELEDVSPVYFVQEEVETSDTSSVRIQYGIPESKYADSTNRKTLVNGNDENDNLVCYPSQAVQLMHGGYPSLQSSHLYPVSIEAGPEHVEIEDVPDVPEVRAHEVSETPRRLPTLQEFIEIRDIREDGDGEEKNFVSLRESGKGSYINVKIHIEVLVLADETLKELRSEMFFKKNSYVCIREGLDFDQVTTVTKRLPQFPKLKAVLLHCGRKHTKEEFHQNVNEDEEDVIKKLDELCTEENVKDAINRLNELYPGAKTYVSEVFPCKGNKNQINIDHFNEAVLRKVCAKIDTEFIGFTEVLCGNSKKLDTSLYLDPFCLTDEGAQRVANRLEDVLDGSPVCESVKMIKAINNSKKADENTSVNCDDATITSNDSNSYSLWKTDSKIEFTFEGL